MENMERDKWQESVLARKMHRAEKFTRKQKERIQVFFCCGKRQVFSPGVLARCRKCMEVLT